jgi:hypothetical protein
MTSLVRGTCFGLLLAALAQLGAAQEIPKSEYIEYEPLTSPRIVGQTRASAAWHLFGDPADAAYRDASPRDGMDDKRHDLLLGLAVRFAPYMVRNTTNIPMDFKGFITRRPSFPLYVDTWDVATARGHLLRTDIVDFAALARTPCGGAASARSAARPSDPQDDCRLLDLLHRFGPGGTAADTTAHTAEAPEQHLIPIIYFDFPGQDPASWKAEFENLVSGELPRRYETYAKVYAHPFIHEVADGVQVGAAYEFVLQYWFFYPYNDSGNKHEGDWEHVNVVVGLLDHPGVPLNGAELRDLLAGAVAPDRLVIRRVEYYFHHNVFLIDYTTPNVYQPRAAWAAEVGRMRPERLGEEWVWTQIRNRAYMDRAETRVNTHPLVYIGGDNKGLDQILALPGGTNRDSHASYPLPGLYKDIGPTGASEEITHGVDFHEVVADSTRGALDRVIRFDDPEKIELVPDWEPVWPLVLSDPDVRRQWSWLVLPIQWGYPATKSPFAGVVKHVDTGNLSPLGPSYNGGWNRTGPAPGYYLYEPHLFSSLFAVGYQDNLVNSMGFLNLTYPTLSLLPPFDLLRHILSLPSRAFRRHRGPTFFPKDRIPFRVVGISVGVSTNYLGDDFEGLLLLPDQAADIDSIIRRTDSVTIKQSATITKAVATYGALHLYIGHRFVSENSLRHSHAALEVDFVLPSRGRAGAVTGDLDMWEYTGSLRYNLLTEAVQPFVLFGYGLSWYRLTQIAFDGQAIPHQETPWVRRPDLGSPGTLLPNTWHLGAGLELIPIRSYARTIPRGLDVGIRFDASLYFHRLGLQSRGIFVSVPDPGVTRGQINTALTLSF